MGITLSSLNFHKRMKHIKLGHAFRFYMHKKVFSQKKNIYGFCKAMEVLSPPFLVIDKFQAANLSVPSISTEVFGYHNSKDRSGFHTMNILTINYLIKKQR